ncbi:MAG: DUF6320 domain-containing protein [Eubacteriales bacterium]|nr:DUF6320 domain-containing protein [Eubacteriales bacterium]
MSQCNQCNVTVRGSNKVCPLCQNQLIGDVDESLYPEISTVYNQYRLIFKILAAITLSGGIVCIGINLMLPKSGFWSVFTVFGILCFWLSVIIVLKRRGNLLKTITFQVLAFSLLFIALDFFIGWTGWSLNFFIPIACTVAVLSIAIIAKLKNIPTEDYGVYLIVDLLFCIVPIVFYFTGLISAVLPSLFCMAVSVVTCVSQIVFEGKNLWQEIVKRFHV